MAQTTKFGNIHKIREFELEKVSLAEEFDILQIVGEGWFGKILLVEHKGTDTEMVLKALPKPYVSLRDFYREFHYGLHLGQHKNVITTYDVAFETAGFYVFSQEYAPLGDLTSNVSENGIGELHSKKVARQIAAALDYLHSKELVHRDVKLDNILVFKSDFSRVKLCDFGETRRAGSTVRRRNEWLPYSPPEVLRTETDDSYKATTSHDVWQFGIVVFVCLTGCLPWQKASSDDPRYLRYNTWHCSTIPLRKQPKLFKLVTSRAQRMFRRFLEPKPEKRPNGLSDLHKFIEDRWLSKGGAEKPSEYYEDDELCPSMYSYHSNLEEKNRLLHTLSEYGIETVVDRAAKKERIRDWIQSSVITEEEAEEEEADGSELPAPQHVAGHFPAMRPVSESQKRMSTIRDDDKKHINPRTGEVVTKDQPSKRDPLHQKSNAVRSKADSGYGSTDFRSSAHSSPTLSRDVSLRNDNKHNGTSKKLQHVGSFERNDRQNMRNGSHNQNRPGALVKSKSANLVDASMQASLSTMTLIPFNEDNVNGNGKCVDASVSTENVTPPLSIWTGSSSSRAATPGSNDSPYSSRDLRNGSCKDTSKQTFSPMYRVGSMKDTPYDSNPRLSSKIK